jgi:hypothetical protein
MPDPIGSGIISTRQTPPLSGILGKEGELNPLLVHHQNVDHQENPC